MSYKRILGRFYQIGVTGGNRDLAIHLPALPGNRHDKNEPTAQNVNDAPEKDRDAEAGTPQRPYLPRNNLAGEPSSVPGPSFRVAKCFALPAIPVKAAFYRPVSGFKRWLLPLVGTSANWRGSSSISQNLCLVTHPPGGRERRAPAGASRPARAPRDRGEGPTDRERRGERDRRERSRPEPTAPNSCVVADTPVSRGVSV